MSNDIWNLAPSLTLNGVTREVPLTNFAGRNYMAYVDSILEAQLEIKSEELVLDVGGGATPFSRANVVTEAFITDDSQRIGQPISKDKKYIESRAEDMPFEEREFDVAISRHVFEHVVDPEAACREIARVARRGYIEVPSPWSEYFYGYPPHRWLVSVDNGILVFRRKQFVRNPFLNCLRWMEYHDADFSFRWNLEYRNLITTQFPWEGEIPCRVESDPGFDYDNPVQAAESHLSFVVNALRFGGVPPGVLEYEVRAALRFQPVWALALNTLGIVLWQAGRHEESQKVFAEARDIEPADDVFRHNAQLTSGSGQPRLKLLPPEPCEKGTPQKNFAGPVFYSSDQLNIGDNEKVLQVVNKGFFFERADVTVDISTNVTSYHGGEKSSLSDDPSESKANALSMPDNTIDFGIARGVLEYIDDPGSMCQEIQRVAKRGFLEVPLPHWDYVYGNPGHRWLCEMENGTLVFRRRTFAKSPFKSVLAALSSRFPELKHRFEISFRNLNFIQLPWEGSFDYRVEDDAACPYDYNRPEHAFLAHMDRAYNLCGQGAAATALHDANTALAIQPAHADALNMRGVIAWSLGRHEEGLDFVRRASEMAPDNKVIMENYRTLQEKYKDIAGPDSRQSGDPLA